MSELQVFSNAEFGSIRSITVNGEPYFVGKDVAEILGYANTRDALAKHVDEEDRMDGVAIRDSIGREQTPVLINESGLYSSDPFQQASVRQTLQEVGDIGSPSGDPQAWYLPDGRYRKQYGRPD